MLSSWVRPFGLALALTLALLSGMVFSTQREAYAFAPVAVAVVAPTVARTVVVPVARAACQTACRAGLGAAAAGAWGAAEAACMFAFGECGLPFGQNPEVPTNSDNPMVGGSGTLTTTGAYRGSAPWTYVGTNASPPSNGYNVTISSAPTGYFSAVGGSMCRNGTNRSQSFSVSGPPGGKDSFGVSALAVCGSGNSVGWYFTNNDQQTVAGGIATFPLGPSQVDTTADPDRQGQGFRKCQHTDGAVSKWAGAPVTYKESSPARTLTLPACPAGTVPVGGGAAAGSPWTPGQQVPAGTGTGTPLLPEWSRPTPEQLPHAPKPGEPQTPRRTLPETPSQPLPEYDPITGAPTGSPQPTPDPYVPEPTPERPDPQPEGPCMWGGYAVDPADCGGAPEPAPRPTAPPSTSPTTPPRLEPDPEPTPSGAPPPSDVPGTSGANPDSEGCLREAWSWNPVSWVLAPVKCALRWAFVPPAGAGEAAVEGVDDALGDTGLPEWGGAVRDVGGGLSGVGATAAGCSGPHFSLSLKGKQYDFDPLNACSQPMQGAAVVVKVLISLAVCVAGAKLCARPVLAAFGMERAV